MPEFEQSLPSVPDIEGAVLGGMLLDKRAITTAIAVLGENTDAFYKPQHEAVWKGIVAMHSKGYPIDQMTIVEFMREQGTLEQAGGEASIASLAGETRSTANIRYHCEILKEKAFLRMLIITTTSARNACFQDTNPAEVANMIQAVIDKIYDAGKKYVRWFEDIMPEVYHQLEEWSQSKVETIGVPSGFPKLDDLTGGWMPGRMIVLAGKTGQGKTAMALNYAINAADRGMKVLYISTEMSHEDLAFRTQAMGMKRLLNFYDVRKFTVGDWSNMSHTSSRLAKLPIAVVAYPAIPVSVIGNMIELHVRDRKIGLVIVDYLQQITGTNHESRRLEVESVSRRLKQYAGKYHIPVIALSQLSRKADTDDDAEPQLSWLRESGAIEQDADQVLFLWDPSDKIKGQAFEKYIFTENVGILELRMLLLKKNRFGMVNRIFLRWQEGATFDGLSYQKKDGGSR